MRKSIFLVCMVILAAFFTNATIYTLDLQSGTLTAGASDSAPLRTVEQTDLGFNVTYTFTKAVLDIPDNGGPVTWHVDGFGKPYEAGKPAVLSRSDSFIIPPGKRCTVSQSSTCTYRSFNYTLADAVPPVTDGGEVIEWESEESQGEVSDAANDIVIYCNDNSMYPQSKRASSGLFYIRDLNNLEVTVTGHNYLIWHKNSEDIQSIINNTKKEEKKEEVTLINEDRVWMFSKGNKYSKNNTFYRFHGTTELNGKIYHNLYTQKNYVSLKGSNEEIKAAFEDIPEFDFEELEPEFYIRQEEQKYYMLFAQEIYDEEGNQIDPEKPQPFGWNIAGQYGSNVIETLIYDFSLEAGEHFFRCTYPGMSEDNVFGFPEKGYFHYMEGLEFFDGEIDPDYQFCKTSNSVEIYGWKEIENNGKKYRAQIVGEQKELDGFLAIPTIGTLKDFLPNPGSFTCYLMDNGILSDGLVSVRTLDGKYIYGEPYGYTNAINAIADKEAEAEYFSMDGRKVAGSPAPGVYIERRGDNVRKVIIK